MKVKLYLSKREDSNGLCEIMLIIRKKSKGKVIDLRSNTSIFIEKKMFDEQKGIVKSFSASKKIMTAEVKYHNIQLNKLNELIFRITEAYNSEQDKKNICGSWLKDVVFPKSLQHEHITNIDICSGKKGIYELFLIFLERKKYSIDYQRGMMVCIRSVARYEMFVRLTDRKKRNFCFDANTVTKADIEDYRKYITNEKKLSEEYPKLFKQILSNYPANIKQGNYSIENRGKNSVYKLMKKLKSFFTWLNREGLTTNQPFIGVELGSEKYGTPYYITTRERDMIASTPMPTKKLETQRDIFVFHCFVGCRVSDLIKLSAANVTDGILTYTPHKTKDEGQHALQARVPLHAVAQELIKKYAGTDSKGRLFPFITPQKYNDAIKEIFTLAGITRNVEVRNALTGETETKPINDVASSHLARRTFCGNLYSKVQDPNLIGKMSGHVEGSKAFARYRKIEDETLKSVIELL